MDTFAQEKMMAEKLEEGIVTFYLSRGHSHEDSKDMAKKHLRGEKVIANDIPEKPGDTSNSDSQ